MIVTHYREQWFVGKKLFDSIAMQRIIDFGNVGVILVNDGEENELPSECFEGYPYEIHQLSIPHGGVSKARNAGLDASTADYVMFCDFDDCFQNVYSLYLVFCGMAENKYDLMRATFTEEVLDDDGVMHLVAHEDDAVFIHGKIMRRQFLIDQNIRFNEKLTIHEDGYFNVLTYAMAAKDRQTKIGSSIYTWAWNPMSVVRKDNSADYILDTYSHLMRQRMALTQAFLDRKSEEHLMNTVIKTVMDAYYDFQKHAWRLPKNKAKYERAERWFCAYLKRFGTLYAKADLKKASELAAIARARVTTQRAMLMESETLEQWLNHIMRDVRPIPAEEIDV